MKLKSALITHEHNLQCPWCSAVVYVARSNESSVPNGGYFLKDGDTIAGLFGELTAQQKLPDAFYYALEVGECKYCDQDYYVFKAKFINSNTNPLGLEDHLRLNVEQGTETNFICAVEVALSNQNAGIPPQWLLQSHVTPGGPMHTHVFGPFRLNDTEGVIGPNGVSSCRGVQAEPWRHAKSVLLSVWDGMRLMNANHI